MSKNKEQVRKHFLDLRAQLTPRDSARKSSAICAALRPFIQEGGFVQIFGFSSIRDEPDLTELYRQPISDRVYGLPRVVNQSTMEFRQWHPPRFDALIKDRFGILTPPADRKHILLEPDPRNRQTLVLVPAAAADIAGVRLGYGGGYYDRYLARFPQVVKMVVVFQECFVQESLPKEDHDQLMDFVVTENGVLSLLDR